MRGRRNTRPVGLVGLSGFPNNGTSYVTTPAGEQGVAGGFWVAGLFVIGSRVGSSTRSIVRTTTGSAGYNLRTTGVHAALSFTCVSGAGSTIASPSYTITAGDVGKIFLAVGVHDGSNVVLYTKRASVGSSAITGYTQPSQTVRVGDGFDGGTILGAAGGRGVPSSADVFGWFDAVKGAKGLVPMIGSPSTTHLWTLRLPSTVPDAVGGSSLNVVGNLSVGRVSPDWSW